MIEEAGAPFYKKTCHKSVIRLPFLNNLKAEPEIRTLHEKIDHLIVCQQQELLNVQQVQVEMMKDIMNHIKVKYNSLYACSFIKKTEANFKIKV